MEHSPPLVWVCVCFQGIGVKVAMNQNSMLWNDVVHVHGVLGSFLVTCVWPAVR